MLKKIIRKPLINISSSAWEKLENISVKTNMNTFLFSAESGGCSGLNFSLKTIAIDKMNSIIKNSKIPPNTFKNNNNVVYIEPLSEMYLIGTTIDYVHEDYNKNIYESKFVFYPDKDKAGTCGCGISFYLK